MRLRALQIETVIGAGGVTGQTLESALVIGHVAANCKTDQLLARKRIRGLQTGLGRSSSGRARTGKALPHRVLGERHLSGARELHPSVRTG